MAFRIKLVSKHPLKLQLLLHIIFKLTGTIQLQSMSVILLY